MENLTCWTQTEQFNNYDLYKFRKEMNSSKQLFITMAGSGAPSKLKYLSGKG